MVNIGSTRDHAREMSGRSSEVAGPPMTSEHCWPCQTLNGNVVCDGIEHWRRVVLEAGRRIALSLEDEVQDRGAGT